jgi:phosphohistidine phosphatase
MRHAKSDWDSDAKTDHERPLNSRGRREAPAVAKALRAKGYVPELALSSDAQRTRETWDGVADELGGPEVKLEPTLYLAGIDGVRASAERHAKELEHVSTLLVLGHNPGWEEMVRSLTGRGVDLKTAYTAVLESTHADESWSEALAREHGFKLLELVKPEDG